MITVTTLNKIELKKNAIKRAEEACELSENIFMGNVKLYQSTLKVENKAFAVKAFRLKEKSREQWYKELDVKIKAEIELKQLIKEELGL